MNIMEQPTTIKGKTKVWLANTGLTINDLSSMQKKGNGAGAINALVFSNADMSNDPNWQHAGFAEVTVTLLDKKQATENHLANLQRELQDVRAESQRRENAILDKISKLQASSYDELL